MQKHNIIRSCLQCGKEIITIQSKINHGGAKFCSRSCSAKYHLVVLKIDIITKKIAGIKRRWDSKRIEKICDVCGSKFSVIQARKDSAKYCSISCQNQARTLVIGLAHPLFRSVERFCKYCAKPFFVEPAVIERGRGIFCSQACNGAYAILQQDGRRSSIESMVQQILVALGEEFESQKPLGPWLVDFFLPKRNIVIECDGDYWHSLPKQIKKDKQKDYWLRENGYQLVRLKECDIRADASNVVQMFALDYRGQLPLFQVKKAQ